MKDYLKQIHYKVVDWMAGSWIVENILIAKVKEDGEWVDCIYCTIIRNAVLFASIGFMVGCVLTASF